MNIRISLLAAFACAVSAGGYAGEPDLSPASWPKGELARVLADPPAVRSRVVSDSGVIVGITASAAVRSGLEALRQGGSAVDAVLTHALAEIVLYASCCVSHAGFMDLMVFEAATGKVYHLNGGWNTVLGEDDPLTIPGDGIPSGRTAMVPGFMAGVEAAHERFGKLPFASLFGPAVYFAEQGFELKPFHQGVIDARTDVLSRRPDTRAVFTRADGAWYRAGDLFRQPELARTLKNVASKGADYMYTGEWGQKLVEAVQSEGGKMTMEDLRRYEPLWSEPLRSTYRGLDVYATAPPNQGGVNLIEALNLVERANLRGMGHYSDSPEALHTLIRIARVMDIMGTSLTHHVTPTPLFKRYAPQVETDLMKRITPGAADTLWAAMATPGWNDLNIEAYRWNPVEGAGNHSDAVVAVDAEGNAAALLHTINTALWGTTGIFVDGVPMADSAKYQQVKIARVGPGKRLPIETNPIMLLKDGRPVIVSSSIGMGVHEQTLQGIVNIIEYGDDVRTAADRPQVLRPIGGGISAAMAQKPEGPEAQAVAEGRFDPQLLDAVRAKGQPITALPTAQSGNWRGYWVGIHIDPESGRREGAGSPFFDGGAMGQAINED